MSPWQGALSVLSSLRSHVWSPVHTASGWRSLLNPSQLPALGHGWEAWKLKSEDLEGIIRPNPTIAKITLRAREKKKMPLLTLIEEDALPCDDSTPRKKSLQSGLNCHQFCLFSMRIFFFERAGDLHAGLFLERVFYLDLTFTRRGQRGSPMLRHLCSGTWEDRALSSFAPLWGGVHVGEDGK